MSSSQEATEIDSEGSSCEERESSSSSSRRRLLLGSDCSDNTGVPKKRRKQSTPIKFSTSSLPLPTEECDNDDDDEDELELPDAELLANDDHEGASASHDYQHQQHHHFREGKLASPLLSVTKSVIQGQHQLQQHHHPTIKSDENLNNEFRCQYCSQFFDSRASLEVHLECDHNFAFSVSNSMLLQQHNRQRQTPSSNRDSPPQPTHSPVSEQPNATAVEPHQQSPLQQPQQSIGPMNLSGISIRSFASGASWQEPRRTNHFPAMPAAFPGALVTPAFLAMPGFPPMDSASDHHLKSRAIVGQLPKIFNREAYCGLCNRELCNKYFLKTHMVNKHGIHIDGPVLNQAQSQSSDVSSSSPSLSRPQLQAHSPLAVNAKIPPEQPLRLDGTNGMSHQQQQQPTLPCDMCPKRFKSEDSLRKHRSKVHLNSEGADSTQVQSYAPSLADEADRQSPAGIEALFKQEFNVEQEDSASGAYVQQQQQPNKESSSSSSSSLNGEHLRRLGVMNPEAFCEICCKEYCNKYFLRVHRLKRHEKPGSVTAATWHQVQTSPLNLIVSDSSLGSEPGAADRTEEPEHACKSCGIRFQNQELFLLHLERIHEVSSATAAEREEPMERDEPAAPDAIISEDLQKLQTMILQLNGLESSKGTATCVLCAKEFESPAGLRSHMLSEHNIISEGLSPPQLLPRDKSSPLSVQLGCPACPDRDFPDQDSLRRHVAEEHQPPTTPTSSKPQSQTPQQQAAILPSTPKSSERKPSGTGGTTSTSSASSLTPTSSYCEICNKELCNKYFMKTHMQKMHGIEIENGAQIGGVVCNICKKELCSKYFLRVHKQNTHGIVEEGSGTSGSSNRVQDTTVQQQQLEQLSSNSEDATLPRPDGSFDSHNQEQLCPICHRRFRGSKWLKLHMQEEHGKAGLDRWRELERLSRPAPARVPSLPSSRTHQQQQQQQPTSLKIPNGFDPNHQIKVELASLGSQVLSNFFGADEQQQQQQQQQTQTYRCSQPNCSFTSTMLPIVLVHERHNHGHEAAGPAAAAVAAESEPVPLACPLQCPFCHQSFGQPNLLRQHVLSRHPNPFSGIMSQFPIPLLSEFFATSSEQQQFQLHHQQQERAEEETVVVGRQQQASPHIMNEIDTNKMRRPEENGSAVGAIQVMPQGTYRCAQCDYATANLNRIKKHVKRDHKSLGDPVETALTELTKTLKDVANKHKIPASYAIPQDYSSGLGTDKTIMQPFIIEELVAAANDTNDNGEDNNDQSQSILRKNFAPALIFLPVKTRLSSSLTTSFTLNPA